MKKHLLIFLILLLPLVASAYNSKINGIYYNLDEGSKIACVVPSLHADYSGELVIPETVCYNGVDYRVTAIERESFYGCTGLTFVSIPSGVTEIGDDAFRGCSALQSITIPIAICRWPCLLMMVSAIPDRTFPSSSRGG